MPLNDNNPIRRGRRAAYSVAETAKLCGLSRARFYNLINNGAMPPPVYSTSTRRPLYTAELAAQCIEVRETNVGVDGRFVMFHERRPVPPPQSAVAVATPARRRPTVTDPVMQEVVESLRSMGVMASVEEISDAVSRRCPQGITEGSFERDLLGLYGDLRSPRSG